MSDERRPTLADLALKGAFFGLFAGYCVACYVVLKPLVWLRNKLPE